MASSCSLDKPPCSLVSGKDSTMCDIVWVSLQEHWSESVSCHLFLQAPQWPCPVRKRFKQNPAVGLWGCPRGGHWPPRPTSRILSTDCWCQLVPTYTTKVFWMTGIVMVGRRYRDVVANSSEHWLSPPVCLWQLSFVELVVWYWQGLVTTEAELGRECQKWGASQSSTVHRPVQCGLNGNTMGHSTRLQSSIELMQMSRECLHQHPSLSQRASLAGYSYSSIWPRS